MADLPAQTSTHSAWVSHLTAPVQWRVVDLISDLHLHPGDPATFAAWQDYLANTTAHAVFILGDLFEVWVGDDVLDPSATDAQSEPDDFARVCADVLRQAGARRPQFFMCGNRDFLVGTQMLRQSALQGLSDPCLLEFAGLRWLLSHGDALCLQDTDYQQFRKMVRAGQWQADFLARPLPERQHIARELRAQSEQHKRNHPAPSIVDTAMTTRWLGDADALTLIHGHTHQPADHALANGRQRIVLSDWDLQARPARAQVLRLQLNADGEGATTRRLTPAQAC
ncbi:MAG: UDP-2,3-diacylglucosamine diphosphatase [Burkholderiaceae bacterium]